MYKVERYCRRIWWPNFHNTLHHQGSFLTSDLLTEYPYIISFMHTFCATMHVANYSRFPTCIQLYNKVQKRISFTKDFELQLLFQITIKDIKYTYAGAHPNYCCVIQQLRSTQLKMRLATEKHIWKTGQLPLLSSF